MYCGCLCWSSSISEYLSLLFSTPHEGLGSSVTDGGTKAHGGTRETGVWSPSWPHGCWCLRSLLQALSSPEGNACGLEHMTWDKHLYGTKCHHTASLGPCTPPWPQSQATSLDIFKPIQGSWQPVSKYMSFKLLYFLKREMHIFENLHYVFIFSYIFF